MPDWTSPLTARLASLRLGPAREAEIIEELSQHLDDVYQERRTAGASHDEAVAHALQELDERDLLAREMAPLRQSSTSAPMPPGAPATRWYADAVHDVAYAVRTLLHAGTWTLAIVLLLALGIGANTALFSATDALLFSPLPVHDADALVRLRWTGPNDVINEHDEYGFNRLGPDGKMVRSSFSYAVFQQLAADGTQVVDLFACAPFDQVNVSVDGHADLANGFGATGNYFTVLGVQPLAGRLFGPADDGPAATAVAVISAQYWQRRFGGDASIVGKVVRANDVPVTIVGVMPPSFTGVQRTVGAPPDIFFPLSLDLQLKASTGRGQQSLLPQPTAWWLEVMGRLRPGASAATVEARLKGVFERTTHADLAAYLKGLTDEERRSSENRNRSEVPRLLVDSGRRGVYDTDTNTATAAAILSAIVGVILLIICANVANLMLSRAVARQREMAVRLSLGATRSRLVRQLLTEALLLAAAGATLGMAVAYWGVQLLPAPASSVSVFHGRTFAFTTLAAIVTSLFFGAVPAFRATRVDVGTGLKEAGRSVVGRRGLLARGLLVVQVALSLVLLVGAGLFVQTLSHLRRADVGFDTRNLLLVRITPQLSGYDQSRTSEVLTALLERLRAVPGVRGAAMSHSALLSGSISSTDIYVEGRSYDRGRPATHDLSADDHTIDRLVVSPGFFRVIGLPVVRGRDLTDRDDRSAPRVALINESAARQFFPGVDPLGRHFGQDPDHTSEIEVVGIVRDAKYSSLREPPPPTLYTPFAQWPRASAVITLRTDGPPLAVAGAVREAVHQVDPKLPLVSVTTQEEQIERQLAQEKLFAEAYVLFGGVALLLASVGLFGLMSYSVSRRTAEMGIRMALGAQREAVVSMVMRESFLIVTIGVIAGLALTAFAGRLVTALLFGLPPYDVLTFAAAIGVMAAVSAVAAYFPARRASLVDPMVALRYE